jgi:carbonic anhydrase
MARSVTTSTTLVAGLLLGASAHATIDAASWSYSGDDGPEHWGQLDEAYELCGAGKRQSPVDLAEHNAIGDLMVSVDWDPAPLNLQNNGKTVQANFQRGSYMTSGTRVFNLVQVHFHTPSEHTLDGETYPLVAHFVHATDEGELGVLGVLFERGDANPELQKLIEAARDAGAEARDVEGVEIDPNGMLPDELEVYRYMGSLTTPPCSESVHWHVVEDTVTASGRQIRALENLMGMNARPTLPLHGRLLVAPE